jgi:hypothetical protein
LSACIALFVELGAEATTHEARPIDCGIRRLFDNISDQVGQKAAQLFDLLRSETAGHLVHQLGPDDRFALNLVRPSAGDWVVHDGTNFSCGRADLFSAQQKQATVSTLEHVREYLSRVVRVVPVEDLTFAPAFVLIDPTTNPCESRRPTAQLTSI